MTKQTNLKTPTRNAAEYGSVLPLVVAVLCVLSVLHVVFLASYKG